MADDKKRKSGKKAKRVLPKEVMGVAIPKDLRRAGDQLIETARSPAGREMLAGALAMAAAAATAAAARNRPHADKPAEPGKPGTDADMVAAVVGKAADAVIDRLFTRRA